MECEKHMAFLRESIQKLVAAKAARKVSKKPICVNPLGVVPKKNGKLRLILDLQHVNRFLVIPKFKFESLLELANLVGANDLLFSIDLQDGYWQWEMARDSHDFLGFEFEGQYYTFSSLPFGVATAPWAFSKVMRELCEVLRSRGIRMLNYLDDFLFLCSADPSWPCKSGHSS
jgi:hypothetical protein